MTSESGLSISKPTSVLKKSIKVNFKDFSKALGKGLVDLGFGKWDSLAGDGVEALSALGLAANAEEIAWLLVYRSLLQAMKNLIDEKTELEREKFDVKALQTGINEALETSSLTINKKFFEHPDKDLIVGAVKPAFVEWLKQCGLSEADAQAISDRLPSTPSDDLIDAVGKFVQMDSILPHNPLAGEHRESRLLIIFDGLDELAMQGKIAEKTAQDFVREVQRKVERFNQREICLQVLISGRELVVQANETDFRKKGQILHVLPYFVPEYDRKNYVDAKKLLKQDQRQLWWQNYGAASGSGYTGLPTELDQGNLTEITAQLLLNYLVALSLRRGELKFSEETNLNAVYADLLKAIYERGWAENQHAAIQGIEEKDFVRILEEIALAAWHGNGRTTTVREIERHCENSNLKNLLRRFQEGFKEDSKASITRLLTAFYFRQSGHDHSGDRTFEFTHKSFGEYLTAKRIVQEVQYIHRKLEDRYNDPYEDWDERRALHRWALVYCPSAKDTGKIEPKPHGGGQRPKLKPQQLETVRQLVEEDNDAILEELCSSFYQKTQLQVSRATMGRIVEKLNLTRKKKHFTLANEIHHE